MKTFLVFLLIALAVIGKSLPLPHNDNKKINFKKHLQTPYTANIDYQIHSNNDLNEFYQVLSKGARRFKFDPHFINTGHPSCPAGDSACFLLNHDNPVKMSSYNTSDDLLNYLASKEFQSIVKDDYVSIALCFKSAPDFCSTTSANFASWVKMVDDFHAKAIATLGENVEIILDGDAKPLKCLEGKWQPWNSVWITNSDPTNSQGFYSNSSEHDYYRFQVLNNPENVTNWSWMASPDVNYGKFSNSSYPYQLWEPDAQEEIQQYKDIYLGGALHEPGYHFAINSDIAMFRVYSSSVGKYDLPKSDRPSGINQALFESSTGVQSSRSPVLTHLTSTTGTSTALAVFGTATDASKLYAQKIVVDKEHYALVQGGQEVIAFSDNVLAALQLSSSNTVIKALPISTGSFVASSLLMVTNGGQVVVTDTVKGENLIISQVLNLGTIYDMQTVSGSICSVNRGDTLQQCFVILSSSSSGVLTVSSAVLATDNSSLQVIQSATISAASTSTISSAKVAIQNNQMIVFASVNDAVLATVLTGSGSVDKFSQTPWVSVTVGRNFDVSLNNDQVLMLTTDYGYCYNSHEHNTRAYPTVCSTVATATQHTLDYSLGLFADWVNVLSASSCTASTKCFAVTSCSRDIFHGTYDLGSKPSIMVLPKIASGEKSMFIEVHEGLNPSELYVGGCGEPLRRDGLVIDSFMIDEWVDTLRSRVQN